MAIRTDIYSIDWSVSPRIINIDISITEANAQDLYDTCKHLEALPNGIDEEAICDAGGWEPLDEAGNFVVITVSLYNAKYKFADRPGPDWVICNMSGGNIVAFTDNTKTTVIYPREPSSYVSADRSSSSSGTLKEQEAIEYASYQNCVWWAISEGYDYPLAKYNRQYPGKILTDAINIAKTKGFSTIQVLDSGELDSGADFSKFKVIGQSHVNTYVNISEAANCLNSLFYELNISGILDGNNTVGNCITNDLSYFSGHIHDSSMRGDILLAGTGLAFIKNCSIESPLIVPSINFLNSLMALSMPGYDGLLKIKHLTNGNYCGIGLRGGVIIIEDSCTNGTIHISGNGYVTDERGNMIFSGTWNGGVTVINDTSGLTVMQVLFETYFGSGSQTDFLYKMTKNKITRDGDVLTIYDDDNLTPYATIDLTNEERTVTIL